MLRKAMTPKPVAEGASRDDCIDDKMLFSSSKMFHTGVIFNSPTVR